MESHVGFPCSPSGKNNLTTKAGDTRDLGSIPGLGRSRGGGNGNQLQCSGLEIPWTEEPGGLQSMGLQRVGLRAVSTFPSTFYGLRLVTDLLSTDKGVLFTQLTYSPHSCHVIPRRSHRASPSLLHKSVSHNTVATERQFSTNAILSSVSIFDLAIFTKLFSSC